MCGPFAASGVGAGSGSEGCMGGEGMRAVSAAARAAAGRGGALGRTARLGAAFFGAGRAAAFAGLALRATDFFGALFFATDFFGALFFATDFFAADFLAADFFGAGFFVTDFFVTDFFGAAFFATDFFATAFFATDFLAAAFFATDFFGAGFLPVVDFRVAAFFAGAFFFAATLRAAVLRAVLAIPTSLLRGSGWRQSMPIPPARRPACRRPGVAYHQGPRPRNHAMRATTPLILSLLAAGAAAPASADVYKCTINGEIRYQDAPCPGQQDQKPHLEIREPVKPSPSSAGQPVGGVAVVALPSESASSAGDSPADPNLGSEGGEATPAQLRAAFEAQAAARAARAAAPPAAPAEQGPPDRLTQLQGLIVQAQEAHRGLIDQQRQAMLALAEKHAGREDSEAAIAERREVEYEWRQRRLRAADEERALQAEISRLCPNGTLSTRGRLECR